MPRGAVAGLVKLGDPVQAADLRDPWALFGWCHPILATIEFAEWLPQVTGGQSVWHLPVSIRDRMAPKWRGATYREFLAVTEHTAAGGSDSGQADMGTETALVAADAPCSAKPAMKRIQHRFADAKQRAKELAVDDPVEALLAKLKDATTADEVEDLVWPRAICCHSYIYIYTSYIYIYTYTNFKHHAL